MAGCPVKFDSYKIPTIPTKFLPNSEHSARIHSECVGEGKDLHGRDQILRRLWILGIHRPQPGEMCHWTDHGSWEVGHCRSQYIFCTAPRYKVTLCCSYLE